VLAGQRQVDRARLAVFGHSQGGIYALLLASGLAGPAPKVRAVGLLEPGPHPLPRRGRAVGDRAAQA
jgi:pimeloyl-ACP methyl ester carboxylesterase